MTDQTRPIVRLRPKVQARNIRHGFPWVYANELVTDRRTKALEPGVLAQLQDADRVPLGTVTVNPKSTLIARMLDPDPDAVIDQTWFEARIARAFEHRNRIYDAPFYRLIHAEADGLPGVVIDRFGNLAVIQPNAAWADRLLDPLTKALIAITGVETVIKNGTGRTRSLEGLSEDITVLQGDAPTDPIAVPMNEAVYMADVMGGQKTGLFYDQRPNHAFAATLTKGARVLDVFSHVGGFSLAALAAGAKSALAIDGSANALALAEKGAAESGYSTIFSTRKGDAFDAMAGLAAEDQKFELVICDPPAFAPSKQALDAGLRAYERVARQAAQLVAANGYLVLCSCSHAADLTQFRKSCVRGIGRAGRSAQLIHTGFAGPDHPLMPQLAESGYLKALFFRLLE
ncbi:RSP_2647 family RNA methyltransferase [Parasulfitobacter algicola]|uniref:Class I SAM-dependent rRNA methyltransferase n=1 Tax=Parasulfitobacter algicola TaxID=2614809 RepID=A0ABX2IXD6_9RHOB|nr:class I SAM-dependent rRNA methyltransferase [Sulfitobacter algicola]NSX55717.1 class I SAM-dependent rRNA methyltransferase [Sulfitobacter algicola]